MTLTSHEHLLQGQWGSVDGRLVADQTCERIAELIRSHLTEVARDASGWDVLYRAPDDGRLWELTYPQSHLHGGGPPQLRHLDENEARTKYGSAAAPTV